MTPPPDPVGSVTLRALALGIAVLGPAACSARDLEDDGTDSDAETTSFSASASSSSSSMTEPEESSGSEAGPTMTTMMMTGTTEPADSSGSDTAPTGSEYETTIQPIWDANCAADCHRADGIMGAFILTAGSSHAVLTTQKPVYSTDTTFVVPGDSANSFLIAALRSPPGTIVRQMPLMLDDSTDPPTAVPGTPLPEATIVLIEAWIDAGANP